MIALIDLYQKELLKVNGFSPSTVETYELSIKAFCRFIKDELQTDLVDINGPLEYGTLLTSVTNVNLPWPSSLSLK